MYAIKEMYYTLQGEGAHTGRPAIFCRFAGCNLWSGREQDRKKAICDFCDTDFVGTDGVMGGKYNAYQLVETAKSLWPIQLNRVRPYIVFTGGEPMLQLDKDLVLSIKEAGFEAGIETNGTLPVVEELDWICVSPKAGSKLVVTQGDELKMVYPQKDLNPQYFENMSFHYFYLQPMDGPYLQQNTKMAVRYCLNNPQWRLSLQTHKLIGLA